MARTRSIEAVLREKKALRDKLNREIELLEQALPIMRGADEPAAAPERREARGRRSGIGVESAVGRAIEFIRSQDRPQHIDKMLNHLGAIGAPAKKQSLVSSLSKLAKQGRLVIRVPDRPSTFGLKEWQDMREPQHEAEERGNGLDHDTKHPNL